MPASARLRAGKGLPQAERNPLMDPDDGHSFPFRHYGVASAPLLVPD